MTSAGPVPMLAALVQLPDGQRAYVKTPILDRLGALAVTPYATARGFLADRFAVTHVTTGQALTPDPLTRPQAQWLLREAALTPHLSWRLLDGPLEPHDRQRFGLIVTNMIARMPQDGDHG